MKAITEEQSATVKAMLAFADGAVAEALAEAYPCEWDEYWEEDAKNGQEKAVKYLVDVLHYNVCGKVPGYAKRNLFGAHSKTARLILDVLKENI